MRIAIAQLNPIVGDLTGNSRLVEQAAEQAVHAGAELLVTTELVISGYPPKDLLLREGFGEACDAAVTALAARLPKNLGVLVGHPTLQTDKPGRIANSASLLHGGRVVQRVVKSLLPNYDVFDEQRYFLASTDVRPIPFAGRMLGVHICEDAWWGEPNTFYHQQPKQFRDPVRELCEAGADVLINLSASPFELAKPSRRRDILARHVGQHHKPFVFVNQVGGNDDLVFDGHSMVYNSQGQRCIQLPGFEPAVEVFELDQLPEALPEEFPPREGLLLDALVLGLRDYMQKTGFRECVLGLSGGIDSALACYIASRAVSPERVHALMMPSRYSSGHSVSDSQQLVNALGMDSAVINIDDVHKAYEQTEFVGGILADEPGGLAAQNLQARIRGAIVMIQSNARGWLPLATGNKSELAVGYCTLYGDMAGGFAVLSDVFKRDVYALARYINETVEGREVIPANIITKAPSAELAPNQFDQDVLPPYDLLDAILEGLIERELSVARLCEQYPKETVEWVSRQLDRNEYKRRQMPPGIKLSQRAFGTGRRMPMAARFNF